MAKRRKKKNNRYRRNLNLLLVTIVVLCFGLVMMYQMHGMREKDSSYAARQENLEQQLAEEQARAEDLKESKENIDSRQNVEQIAREKLGLVKPDDVVIKAKE